MKKAISGEFSVFLLAVQFMTRLPTPRDAGFSPERLTAATRYYPLVGAIVGVIAAGVFYAANLFLPVLVAVLLSTAAGLLVTGAFHEDGLADTFDGIGGGNDKKRALEIMKDSRIGVFGAAALFLALAIKVATLSALDSRAVIAALVAAHGLSRFSSVFVIATSRYVRLEGVGKHTSDGVSAVGFAIAGLTALFCLAAVGFFLTPAAALWAAAGLCAGHLLMRAGFERKLGGYTGDTLGAVQQASEIGVYLGLLAWA